MTQIGKTPLPIAVRARVLLGVLAVIAVGGAVAQDVQRDGYFNVRSASLTLNEDGVHELDARLQLLLSEEANDALTSGVPLTIELQLEMIRVRRFIPDALSAELVLQYELEYRPLSQRYIVRNLNSGEQESFATLYSALNNLGRVQSVPVIDDALLETDSGYRIRLRSLLSLRQYPAPLRMLFFWRSQWQLASEWYEWRLER